MMAILALGLKQGDVSTMELGVDKILLAKWMDVTITKS